MESMSVVADNVRQVLSYMSWDYNNLLSCVVNQESLVDSLYTMFVLNCSERDVSTAHVIKELCLQRDNIIVSNLNSSEVTDLLTFLCIS